MQVLIDSSAWIPLLRNRSEKHLHAETEALLSENRAAMTDPNWFELYRGVRGRSEERHLENLRDLCRWLEFDPNCWSQAAICGRACLRAGVNVPTGDLLVFGCKCHYEVDLLHRDRHFEMIEGAMKRS